MSPSRSSQTARTARGTGPGHGNDVVLLAIVGVLTVVGLVMVLSASSVQSQREVGSTWSYFGRQLLWAVVGVGGMGLAARFDYRRLARLATPALLACLVLLVLVLVPGIGVRVNSARSWLAVGPLRMQPAELMKLALLVFSAQLLARRAHRMHDGRLTLLPVGAVAALVGALVLAQSDLGAAIVLGGITFSVLFVAGVPLGRLSGVGVIAVGATLLLALSKSYRRNRLLAFLDPAGDPLGIAFQLNQSFMGIASGGWFGAGLGQSRAKWGFLPNAHTDFIYAIISEELGLVGAMVVAGLFVAFAVFGIRAALAAPDRFGTLLAAGIVAWILLQAFVNIGGVVGLLPITGLTLPFISFGGTSLLITLVAAGILLNVARQGTSEGAGPRGRAAQMA